MVNAIDVARFWVLGLQEGFPICCISAYVKDRRAGRLPAMERKAYDGYVPCSACGKRMGGETVDDVYAVSAVVIVARVLQALGIAWLAVGMVNHDLAVQGVGILCVIIAVLMLFFIERETGGKSMAKQKSKVKSKSLSNAEKKAVVKGTLVPAEMGERMASKLGKIWGW